MGSLKENQKGKEKWVILAFLGGND